jgi:PAS domain S-box-containing protein
VIRIYTTQYFQIKELDQLVELFSNIFVNSYDGLFVCDKDGYPLLFNDALLKITGWTADFINSYGSVFSLEESGFLKNSPSINAIRTKKTNSSIVDYATGKKAVVTATPVLDQNQNVLYVVTNVRDVTELNRLQEELIETKQINSAYQAVLEQMKEDLEADQQFVYRSKAMQQIVSLAARFAKNDSPILILGESGVGKDVLAQYIHKQSQRKGNFIKINCGAIPEHLLESELFGHEKGAFTGANKSKKGLFELAHKGTIFLDEIGDLPYPLQVKLLNVLQDSKIRRVGATEFQSVDMRVIAATNSNLESLVAQKKFRQDLYYRLNVLALTIPPLRERQDDIPPLLFHFLRKLENKYGIEARVDDLVLQKCLEYDWPGNVRELKNLVERMYHMAEDGKITLDELPAPLSKLKSIAIQNLNYIADANHDVPLKEAMAQFERWYISNMLSKTSTMQECADKLGVNISTLVRKKSALKITKG